MKKTAITLLLLSGLILNQCEKTVYYDDIETPEFLNVPAVSAITDSSAVISWTTSEACSCNLEYTVYLNSYYPEIISSDEYRQNHSVVLDNLWPDVEYFGKVDIFDFYLNGPVSSDTVEFTTTSNLLSQTWQALNNNETDQAATLFASWEETEPNSKRTKFTDAWLTFKTSDVDNALGMMTLIYADYPEFLPNIAGLVVANFLTENYTHAIIYAEKLFDINETWSFAYDKADLNHRYIRLMLAESEIMEYDFSAAKVQIDYLWPENNLDEDVASTWLVDGVTYTSYEAALLAVIDYLYKIL